MGLEKRHPPHVLGGQVEAVVFVDVGGLDQDAEIQQALVQPVGHILGVAAVQVEADAGVFGPQPVDHPGDEANGLALPAPDVHIPADGVLHRGELGLGLVHHGHDLLSPLAQQHPLGGQIHPVAAAYQQGVPQAVLQVLDLPGQGGLGQVQVIGGPGDAALPGHRQKIAQRPYLHVMRPPLLMFRSSIHPIWYACQAFLAIKSKYLLFRSPWPTIDPAGRFPDIF